MIKELQSMIPKRTDGFLITSEENRRYFTSFPSSDGVLIVTRTDALFLTDSRYIEAARNSVKDCRVEELKRLSQQAPDICRQMGIKSLITESEKMTVAFLKALRKAFAPVSLSTVGGDEIIEYLRMIKSREEIDCIIKAQRIAEDALNFVLPKIKDGVTEKEIALQLDFYMLSHGAQALSFETIAVAGKKTSMPHGVPDGNIIRTGDFVTMDFGAVVGGYHSDMTRTVAVGRASDKMTEVYNTVLKAQQASLEFIKSGVLLKEADSKARDVITEAGYGEYFRHSTGHGVGIEIHEKPNLSPNAKGTLPEGAVVTVEPGIYIPSEFGVRIEDMVWVQKDSNLNLTKADKNLIFC